MSSLLRVFLLAALLALPASASAQLRSGVALSSIVGDGERVLSVTAPDAWELPARVRLACDSTSTACARIDVWVCGSTAEADARLAAALLSSSTVALVPRSGVGETAHADVPAGAADLVIAIRDNVVFSVRSLVPQLDALEIAGRIDAAILAAPTGDERATRADPTDALVDPGENGSLVVQAPSAILDETITASGSATARRTASGWLVGRGTGAFELFAWVVDDHLRVGNVSIGWDPMATESRR